MNPGEIYAKTDNGSRNSERETFPIARSVRSRRQPPVGEVLERRGRCTSTRRVLGLERAGLIAKRFSAPSVAEDEKASAPRSEDEVERFIAAQQQLSALINEHLGFRGYLMMMRLQRAENLRDLHDFLPDFAQALVKRTGMGAATQIVARLERLIVGG